MSIRALVVLAALLSMPPMAHGDQAERPAHVMAAGGGYLALTGPADFGGQAVVTLKPGGSLGRFGGRVSVRSYQDQWSCGFLALGITFEAAASRPRLVLDLFAEVGLDSFDNPVAGGGIHTQLFALGPVALVGETGLHLIVDGVDTSLAVSGTLMLGLGF